MKSSSVLAALALATSVAAWGNEVTKTTEVYVTYTTICPVTSTTTEAGNTYYHTYTTTSTVVDHIKTTIVETIQLPDTTIPVETGVTSTITSLCPITETTTIAGETIYKTWTSTSLIYNVLPTKVQATATAPPTTVAFATGVTSVITSLCPITETKTIAGETITEVWTSTSLIYTVVQTKVEEYTTLAPITTYIETYVFQTSTSLCPITETKTVSGKVVEGVYTSTSLVVEKIPTTIYETVTLLTTCYATQDVYTTLSEYETYYTTVSAGSTVVIPVTETNTVLLTSSYTITKTLEPPTTKATIYVPITLGTTVFATEVVTFPSEVTATLPGSSVFTTIPIVQSSTVVLPASTITPVSSPSPSPSAPVQISTNAAAQPTNGPLALAIAGAMAMIALV
ncbi:hypothetical protein LZ554_006189 [Drepanopeziza brunnea f. sp. 'monogermtubi']|nr:hypothetical protein LZ554_006189 [Drepanopeziza brunnea f. sp. 'monogermtubi']